MSQTDDFLITLCAAVAQEITELRLVIETLASALASDEHLARTYTEQLQSFDMLAQCSEELARVLLSVANGVRSLDAVEQVRVDLIQNRLRAALKAS